MKQTIRMPRNGGLWRTAVTVTLSVALAACFPHQTLKPPDDVGGDSDLGPVSTGADKTGAAVIQPDARPSDPLPMQQAKAKAETQEKAIETDTRPSVALPGTPERQPFSTRYAYFQPAGWDELPSWLDDNVAEAWQSFRQSCAVLRKKTAWQEPCLHSSKVSAKSNESIRQFFQREFTLYAIHNTDRTPEGVITGYYEAQLKGSRRRGGAYLYPVYARPEDLLTLDIRRIPRDRRGEPLSARLEGRKIVPALDGSGPFMLDLGGNQPDIRDKKLRVRLDGSRVVPYFTRSEIERLGLPKARVLVWVDNPAALYSMQIQGSGKVRLPDGKVIRLAYAEQNGHPFQPPVSRSRGEKTRITTRGLNIELPEDDESDPFRESEDALTGATMRSIRVGKVDRPNAALAENPSASKAEDNKETLSAEVEALVDLLAQGSPSHESPVSAEPRPVSPQAVRIPKATTAEVETTPLPAPSPDSSLITAISADPSYVFFQEIPDSPDGPLGALGVPLTAGRSVAVDPRTTPLGFPLFLATTEPDGKRLNRLVMAQDTGGAIRGAVRADYFWGFGTAAYAQASRMKESGRMWLLLPRGQEIAARDSPIRMRGGFGEATSAVECVVADPDLCVEDP
jgi:membrane-bound lytic murein transglycosylase A